MAPTTTSFLNNQSSTIQSSQDEYVNDYPQEFYDRGEWYTWSLILGAIGGFLWVAFFYQIVQIIRYSRIYTHGKKVDAIVNQKYLDSTDDMDAEICWVSYKYKVDKKIIRSACEVDDDAYNKIEIGNIVKIKYDPFDLTQSVILNGGKNANKLCRQFIYLLIILIFTLIISYWIYWQSNHLNHFMEGMILGFSIIGFCLFSCLIGCRLQNKLCTDDQDNDDDESMEDIEYKSQKQIKNKIDQFDEEKKNSDIEIDIQHHLNNKHDDEDIYNNKDVYNKKPNKGRFKQPSHRQHSYRQRIHTDEDIKESHHRYGKRSLGI